MIRFLLLILSILLVTCSDAKTVKPKKNIIIKKTEQVKQKKVKPKKPKDLNFTPELVLTNKNCIPFFKKYGDENPETKVRISTEYGDIDLKLYEKTPYHRANFIYLTKIGYFDNTYFHRVVKDFIIQGGNSDRVSTSRKRRLIGKYLLPPDTRKGFKHHRGVISVPSSEIDNPHKLASPYEFFIVDQSPGAYHLDGHYTAFGEIISGIEVVHKIASLPADKSETPYANVRMEVKILD